MKTVYLRAKLLNDLINDIRLVIKDYSGEMEDDCEGISCHLIGDVAKIPATIDESSGETIPAVMVGAFHANLLVPEGFDTSIFTTQIPNPKTPVHQFA